MGDKIGASLMPASVTLLSPLDTLGARLAQVAPVLEFAPLLAWRHSKWCVREVADLRREWNECGNGAIAPDTAEGMAAIARRTAALCRDSAARLPGWYQRWTRRNFLFVAAELEDLAEAVELSASAAVRDSLHGRLSTCPEPVASTTDWRRALARL